MSVAAAVIKRVSPEKKPSNRRRVVVASIASLLLLGGLAALVVAYWPAPVPSPEAPPETLVKFAATDAWTKLTPDQLQRYYDKFDNSTAADKMAFFGAVQKLSEEERMKAMGNFWGTRMTIQARKYAKLSPDEKKKELDKQIDEMQKRRAQMPAMMPPTSRPAGGPGGPGGGGPPGGGRGWGSPERQKAMMENAPPGDRAAMVQFMADMRARMAERGIQGGWGPGGGGGGAKSGGGR